MVDGKMHNSGVVVVDFGGIIVAIEIGLIWLIRTEVIRVTNGRILSVGRLG